MTVDCNNHCLFVFLSVKKIVSKEKKKKPMHNHLCTKEHFIIPSVDFTLVETPQSVRNKVQDVVISQPCWMSYAQ